VSLGMNSGNWPIQPLKQESIFKKKISYRTTGEQENSDDWFKEMVPNYRFLDKSELPQDVKWGVQFDSFCIDPTIYLTYLKIECIAQGIHFRRSNLSHISEAFHLHHGTSKKASVVINCTGVMASKLGGVEDDKVVPVKGQLVLVRNEFHGMISIGGENYLPVGEHCYIMGRPFGGGTVLGGSSHESWDPRIDMDLSKRIMQQAIRLCPHLVKPGEGIRGLDVIHHSVGLRPTRAGGPRIEWEKLPGNLIVIHNYGAGGFGFQSSWGMAYAALRQLKMALSTLSKLGRIRSAM